MRVRVPIGHGERTFVVRRSMIGEPFGAVASTPHLARSASGRLLEAYRRAQFRRTIRGSDAEAASSMVRESSLVQETPREVRIAGRASAGVGVPRVNDVNIREMLTNVGLLPPAVRRESPRTSTRVRSAEPAPVAATDDVATPAAMLEAGIHAFWTLAERWKLSGAEQCALLQVSDSTRLRWRKALPTDDGPLLDRLQLILLAYQRANELAGSEAEAAALVRRPGSALNPALPEQSILEMLSVASILELHRHYQRLEAEVTAW